MHSIKLLVAFAAAASAACPYMSGDLDGSQSDNPHNVERRQEDGSGGAAAATEEFLSQFYFNDEDSFITTDAGGPIADQDTLSAGERGPALLEDFIFRQKIQRFDHERVCWPTLQ
jgi:catalase